MCYSGRREEWRERGRDGDIGGGRVGKVLVGEKEEGRGCERRRRRMGVKILCERRHVVMEREKGDERKKERKMEIEWDEKN